MTAISTGAEGFLGRYAGLTGRLPGATLPAVAALREAAAATFRRTGFPTRRAEAWKYTDLNPVAQSAFHEPLTAVDGAVALPPETGAIRAVFVDGRFRDDLSALPAYAMPLALDPAAATRGIADAVLPMVALNTMLFEDGLVVDLAEGVDGGTLDLVSASDAHPTAFHPRHVIRLGAGASLLLIERNVSAAGIASLHNPVFEIDLGAGAKLTHLRLNTEAPEAFHVATIAVRCAADAVYDSFALNLGARITRNEMHVALNGTGAAAHLNGAQLLDGTRVCDTSTYLDHAAPGCASRQTYKSVLAGRSRGVFQGKILVRQIAQKTDGYQMNQALLLSDEAEMDAKPQLEIYADDVKCSHGATIGALDEEAMFFLRSRGIPMTEARALLVEAFVQDAIAQMPEEAARDAVRAVLTRAWKVAA
ncbi:iron-regulated ABC transporter permease protein SufD [Humitalea rosea]|uniref:Iron-regulated ABC transporter permease protein SufD n=1 Tax=Humitalea rosea TaxID=990373 RepID=A0A2W7IAV9_9PROT|nr:Fe-S cluster assembly protein SufD [Humitalea rosea]PZW42215.1 iron-regulated ABC transporter permease protein SufD [Humitalea rosea]